MRTRALVVAGAAMFAVTACKGDKKAAVNDDLQKDLALASTQSGLTLAPTGSQVQTSVSAIERSTPGPLRMAPSNKVVHHRRVKHAPEIAPVEVASTAPVEAAPAAAPAPTQSPPSEEVGAAAPRPHPVESTPAPTQPGNDGMGGAGGGTVGRGGSTTGAVIGSILGVILRGGVVDGDHCDPRSDRHEHRGGISINNRMPPIMHEASGSYFRGSGIR